jgi:hypothetical protein
MLYHQDPTGLIVIGQPAHAWVAGQLVRAWHRCFPLSVCLTVLLLQVYAASRTESTLVSANMLEEQSVWLVAL